MKSPNTFVTELMRAPIMGVDARSQVRATLAHSDNNEVHFFGVLRHGRVVGQACVCDLRDASPDSPMSAVMQPLIITLSPDTSAQESLVLLQEGMDWTIVMEGAKLVGVVTWHDVRQVMAASCGEHDEYRCTACAADHRLRVARNGLILCPDCGDRAVADDWYDLGAAG